MSKFDYSDWFIFSAKIDKSTDFVKIKKSFMLMIIGIAIFSGLRQIIRNHVGGDVDIINVLITITLTVTFYPLLYKSYQFAYKGTEEKETTVVLRSIALVGQLALIRDLLYCIFALLYYRASIFKSGNYNYNRGMSQVIFVSLDSLLWWLTIIYMIPIVMVRLRSQDEDKQQSYNTPFLLSAVIFWITYIFNYIIIRIFVELPLGREFFD